MRGPGLTGNSTDHGNRGEEASQALATHDGGCVVGRQDACQSEEAGLQNGTKRWRAAKTACQQGSPGALAWTSPTLISAPSPDLQLMSTILTMVTTKKDRASMSTFTRAAVTRNTSRMATRLPKIRTDWGILEEAGGMAVGVRKGQPGAEEAGAGWASWTGRLTADAGMS